MIFPDCRNDNYYNEDFVGNADIDFLKGFDWVTEEVVDNFFDNVFDGLPIEEGDGKLEDLLNSKVPVEMRTKYEMEFAFGRKNEVRKVETYADFLRMKLLEWIEMERNELITSMIDNMDEELYDAIRNKKLKDNSKKPKEEQKEYYNSRKYMITGKKETE